MRNDEDIKTDVIDELIWEPSVDATRIDVDVKVGIVTLSGLVPTYYEKYTAEDAAQRVLGVETVVNNIDVQLAAVYEKDDADIEQAARNNLIWNTLVPEDDIAVNVEDGWVTLEGKVEWNYQKRAATNAVRYLAGVRGVTNLIQVQPGVSFENPKEKIKKAIKRDAVVNADQIDVNVEGTKAVLEGTVSTWLERRRVERAAWSTPGIYEVENNLAIKTNM